MSEERMRARERGRKTLCTLTLKARTRVSERGSVADGSTALVIPVRESEGDASSRTRTCIQNNHPGYSSNQVSVYNASLARPSLSLLLHRAGRKDAAAAASRYHSNPTTCSGFYHFYRVEIELLCAPGDITVKPHYNAAPGKSSWSNRIKQDSSESLRLLDLGA